MFLGSKEKRNVKNLRKLICEKECKRSHCPNSARSFSLHAEFRADWIWLTFSLRGVLSFQS